MIIVVYGVKLRYYNEGSSETIRLQIKKYLDNVSIFTFSILTGKPEQCLWAKLNLCY